MTDEEKTERVELETRRRAAQQVIWTVDARLAELNGKVAEAAFYRALTEPISRNVHAEYIAMRAEEYRNSGRFWEHEIPADLAEIRALLGIAPPPHQGPLNVLVDCDNCHGQHEAPDCSEPSAYDDAHPLAASHA
jgi:hypothetical protein